MRAEVAVHEADGDAEDVHPDADAALQALLEKINEIEEVSATSTIVILSTFKESKVLPIP